MKLNIAVVFGGRSVEHEISIISALQTMAAMDREKYQIIPVYIAKDGIWYTGKELLTLENYANLESLISKSTKIIIDQNSGSYKIYLKPPTFFSHLFGALKPITIDVFFPIMHGTNGEDGTLQGLFTTMNIPYVGCDTLASAITMDKITTKFVLQSMNIKVVDYLWFHAENWLSSKDHVVATILKKFSYPLIVKPGNLGSSIGVLAVNNDRELEDAIDLAVRMSSRFLIEPRIMDLQEINCSVLGDREQAEVSICEELVVPDAILSYQDKYFGGKKCTFGLKGGNKIPGKGMHTAKRKIPAEISETTTLKIQEIAKKVFMGLNCNGVARIDFLMDKGSSEIYLCELNVIPGSLAFYLWEPMGKSFPDLIEQLIGLALKRHRENNNLLISYAHNILNSI